MSSSDSFPDWNLFSKREAPSEIELLLSPASEAASLLQRYKADLDGAKRAAEEFRNEGVSSLAQLAVLVAQLETALRHYEKALAGASLGKVNHHLRVLKDMMLDSLRSSGLEVEVPLGRAFGEIADWINVAGWRHHEEFTSEVVAEVVEPIVRHCGSVVRLGRVIMGAPPDQATSEFDEALMHTETELEIHTEVGSSSDADSAAVTSSEEPDFPDAGQSAGKQPSKEG